MPTGGYLDRLRTLGTSGTLAFYVNPDLGPSVGRYHCTLPNLSLYYNVTNCLHQYTMTPPLAHPFAQ